MAGADYLIAAQPATVHPPLASAPVAAVRPGASALDAARLLMRTFGAYLMTVNIAASPHVKLISTVGLLSWRTSSEFAKPKGRVGRCIFNHAPRTSHPQSVREE
jgi:hypothetical protein